MTYKRAKTWEEYLRLRFAPGPGCWPWLGSVSKYGYGTTGWRRGTEQQAHRAVYELLVGPIPDGLTLDHTCHNKDRTCASGRACLHRRCVNPNHLAAVPAGENTLSGRSPSALNASKTHCPQGHPYTRRAGARGWRMCQPCFNEKQRIRRRLFGRSDRRKAAS